MAIQTYVVKYRAVGSRRGDELRVDADSVQAATAGFAAANPMAQILSVSLDDVRFFEGRFTVSLTGVPPETTDDEILAGLRDRVDGLITIKDEDEDEIDVSTDWLVDEIDVDTSLLRPVSPAVYRGGDADAASVQLRLEAASVAVGKSDYDLVVALAAFACTRPGLAQAMIEHVESSLGVGSLKKTVARE